MRKVLKFVKGRRDEKKDVGPFAEEASGQAASLEDEANANLEHGCGYKVDISGKDKSVSKLHKAAWQGNLEKLKVNMKKIDIDITDKLNRTPLHLASAQGHTNIVWFLLSNKAKLNICDNEGKTPFLKAIECGNKDAVHLMLERGVDLNTIDYSGNSGLHIAAKQGFYEIASVLLKQGANFENSNNVGESPLHIATQAEHRDLVELLLRYGSSVNVVDRDNRSPLMFAAKRGSMALVQLFLEYGAQRKVMDSNDWTAEDYALLGGHHEVAAELKSPSDVLVLPFGDKSDRDAEEQESFRMSVKRSVSAALLPLGPSNDKCELPDEDGTDKKADDVDSSDTWNDSQPSEPNSKPQSSGLKMIKFLPPSSDDDLSEESAPSSKAVDEVQDSPRSCVIPPPCKPPRSWDLIQSGVIDNPKGSEPRRRSLLTLGSLRSKRESFTESPSGADSPSLQGESPHLGQGDADQWVASRSFTKYDEMALAGSPATKSRSLDRTQGAGGESNVLSRDSLKGSDSDSDWDSDDSLPLDNLGPITTDIAGRGSSPSLMLAQLPGTTETVNGIGVEKRGRMLLRASSIDLTDSDCDRSRDKSSAEKEVEKAHVDLEAHKTQTLPSIAGTLGRNGTMMGYEEVWEANPHLSVLSGSASSASDAHMSIQEEMDEAEAQSTKNSLALNSDKFSDNLVYPSPQLEQRPKQASLGDTVTGSAFSNEQGGVKNGRFKLESRSLDGLDDKAQLPSGTSEVRLPCTRKHSRQHSISMLSWSRSEETYQKPPPSNLERMIADNKRINKQLECYDEALRELAQVSLVKKQSSLPLPQKKDMSDPCVMRYVGPRNQRYLSLPRTNELIDEAFKEIGQSSVTMKRGSLSLPRTITPKAMAAEADPVPPPQRKKSFRSRRRAESEGEAFGTRLKDHINRSLSFDVKLHSSNKKAGSETSLLKTHGLLGKTASREATDSPSGSETPRSDVSNTSIKEAGAEKPIRKKRKILLAMRCFRGQHRESLNGSTASEASVQESFDEPPFWMSTDRGSTLERQSTVIEMTDFNPHEAVTRPVTPVIVEPVVEEEPVQSEQEEMDKLEEQAIVEKQIELMEHLGLKEESKKEEFIRQTNQDKQLCERETEQPEMEGVILTELGMEKKSTEVSMEEKFIEEVAKTEVGVEEKFDEEVVKTEFVMEEKFKEEMQIAFNMDEQFREEEDDPLEEQPVLIGGAPPPELVMEEEEGAIIEFSAATPVEIIIPDVAICTCVDLLASNEPPSSRLSLVSVEGLADDQRAYIELRKDSVSDGESGLSQNDITPQHKLPLKSHHSLLKEHLRVATAEQGRLEETAAQLGEQIERLKYDLAEAREATHSRDEVIALLQGELLRMEDMYTCSLDEAQCYRLRLANLEQELRHLKEVCNKFEDEKAHLQEIIRLKDIERTNMDRNMAVQNLEKRLNATIHEKDQERTQQEMLFHLKYLEQEKTHFAREVLRQERRCQELQAKLDELDVRNQKLAEENTHLCSRSSQDILLIQKDSENLRNMYESGLQKLGELVARSKQESMSVCALTQAQSYCDNLQTVILHLEVLEEKDHAKWSKIKEDVKNAVQHLKEEYSKVKAALSEHNQNLEALAKKLQHELDESSRYHHPTQELKISETNSSVKCSCKNSEKGHEPPKVTSIESNLVDLGKVEPNPVDLVKVELNPVDLGKIELNPVDLVKVELNPVDLGKIEPNPVDLVKIEPNPVDLMKVKPNPVNLVKVETKPVDLVKVEPNSVNSEEVESNPEDHKGQEIPQLVEVKEALVHTTINSELKKKGFYYTMKDLEQCCLHDIPVESEISICLLSSQEMLEGDVEQQVEEPGESPVILRTLLSDLEDARIENRKLEKKLVELVQQLACKKEKKEQIPSDSTPETALKYLHENVNLKQMLQVLQQENQELAKLQPSTLVPSMDTLIGDNENPNMDMRKKERLFQDVLKGKAKLLKVNEKLQKEVAEMKKYLEAAKSNNVVDKEENVELKSQLLVLKERLKMELDKTKKGIESRHTQTDKQEFKCFKENEPLKNELDGIRRQLSDLEQELDMLIIGKECETYGSKVVGKANDVSDIKDYHNMCFGKLEKLSKILTQLQQENAELKQKIQAVQNEKKELEITCQRLMLIQPSKGLPLPPHLQDKDRDDFQNYIQMDDSQLDCHRNLNVLVPRNGKTALANPQYSILDMNTGDCNNYTDNCQQYLPKHSKGNVSTYIQHGSTETELSCSTNIVGSEQSVPKCNRTMTNSSNVQYYIQHVTTDLDPNCQLSNSHIAIPKNGRIVGGSVPPNIQGCVQNSPAATEFPNSNYPQGSQHCVPKNGKVIGNATHPNNHNYHLPVSTEVEFRCSTHGVVLKQHTLGNDPQDNAAVSTMHDCQPDKVVDNSSEYCSKDLSSALEFKGTSNKVGVIVGGLSPKCDQKSFRKSGRRSESDPCPRDEVSKMKSHIRRSTTEGIDYSMHCMEMDCERESFNIHVDSSYKLRLADNCPYLKEKFQQEPKEKLSLQYSDRMCNLKQLTDLSNLSYVQPAPMERQQSDFPEDVPVARSQLAKEQRQSSNNYKNIIRPFRDAATNTSPSKELQRELLVEREKSRRNQQSIKRLKTELQLLKSRLGNGKKGGKMEANLAVAMYTSNTTNTSNISSSSSTLSHGPPISPRRFDQTITEFQKQVEDLEQKVRDENNLRFSLEVQVNKMRYELQEKFHLERELGALRNRLEKDFVSRYELDQLRRQYEAAILRAKQEAEFNARDDLSARLRQINSFIEKQVQEQALSEQLRNSNETQTRQHFQDTRLKLLSELTKVQATLQEKGEKEKELRHKCERLARECERKQEMRRKKLIEKSYNVNHTPLPNSKEELISKDMLEVRSPDQSSPTHVCAPGAWPMENPFSHILRRELERNIRRHSRTDLAEPSGSAPPTTSEEKIEILRKKYFLH